MRLGVNSVKAAIYAPLISEFSEQYGINTRKKMCHFLAQICIESGYFRYVKEIWGPTEIQKDYEGRVDLGNTQPGDGKRFMGRGVIQITGRWNYAFLSRVTGIDYVKNPALLERPRDAVRAAFIFWKQKKINDKVDLESLIVNPKTKYLFSVESVTRLVNGGQTHIDRRNLLFLVALKEFQKEFPLVA